MKCTQMRVLINMNGLVMLSFHHNLALAALLLQIESVVGMKIYISSSSSSFPLSDGNISKTSTFLMGWN